MTKYDTMKIEESLDAYSKSLFMKNGILRLILKNSVPVYANCDLDKISDCFISNNPAFDASDVNSVVNSLYTEDINGKTKMDYCVGVTYPDSTKRKIDVFVNLEAQGYGETKKARRMRKNVYSSRLVLNQMDAIKNMNYDQFVDTVSIWIYVGKQSKRKGKIIVTPKVDYDYTNKKYTYIEGSQDCSMLVVSVYLGESENDLIDFMNKLYDKKNIEKNSKEIEEKYGLKLKEDMKKMCSLDEYVLNEGIKKGKREGIEMNTISNLKSLMETLNLTITQAMKALKLSEEDCIKYQKLISNE